MRTRKTSVVASVATLIVLGSFAAACSSSSKTASSTTTTPTTPTSRPPASEITVTAGDYTYAGVPATIPAGIVQMRFVNQGAVPHEMVFVRVPPGTTTKAFFAGLSVVLNGGPFPATFLAANGVPDTPSGHTTSTSFNLTPGDHIAFCTDNGIAGSSKSGPPHFTRHMYKTVTVTGTGGNTPPTATATITAHDYGFALSHLTAGSHTIAFKNIGPAQWHFADLNVFPKGTTIAQAQHEMSTIATLQGPPPFTEVIRSQLTSPGNGSTFTAALQAGRTYIVLCFVSDKTGGPPHAIGHHMYKIFTVA